MGPPAEDAANLLEKGGGEKETPTRAAEQSELDLDDMLLYLINTYHIKDFKIDDISIEDITKKLYEKH